MAIVSIDDLATQTQNQNIVSVDDLEKQAIQQNPPTPQDQGFGSDFERQATKQLYENLPFGKRIIKSLPGGDKFDQSMQEVPQPKDFGGKAGEFTGSAASFIPSFESGAGLVKAGKLIAGATGVGAQQVGKAQSEGADSGEAFKQGAEAAGGTIIGGKILQGAGKVISSIPKMAGDTSSFIYNQIAKLPKGAYTYSKDPLTVLKDERIPGNSVDDFAKNAQERLDIRSQELNDAVKNSGKNVDISGLNSTIDNSLSELGKSTNPEVRDSVSKKLQSMKEEIASWGDLKNMPLKDAINLKRQLAKDYPFSLTEPKSSTANTPATIAHKIYGGINEAVESVEPQIASLNQKVSGLIDITKAAENRAHIESRNNPVGLIGTILGVGAAGAYGGYKTGQNPIETGLTAVVALKALQSPAVMTRIASALSRFSDVDKINIFKTFPFLKKSTNPDIQNQIKRLEYKPTAVPEYLKQRQNIPDNKVIPSEGNAMRPIPNQSGIEQFNQPKAGEISLISPTPRSESVRYIRNAPKGAIFDLSAEVPRGTIIPRKGPIERLNDKMVARDKAQKSSGMMKKTLGASVIATGALASESNANPTEGSVLKGQASTYGWGEKLNSNVFDGSKFDTNKVAVAMRNVPMGTKVEVTDKKTGKTIEAVVNDGGPAKKTGRVVDLTSAAWKKLGYSKPGLADVEVKIIKNGEGKSYPRVIKRKK